MSSFYEDASLVMIPSGYKTSKVYSAKPTDGAGDLVFTRSNDTATRVGPDGLIEKVRTNLLLQSNTFSDASWNKTYQGVGSVAVVTPNYTTDPFGGNNAWRFQCNLNGGTTASDRSWMLQPFTPIADTILSIYIKLNAAGSKTIVFSNAGGNAQTITSTDWVRINIVTGGSSGEFRIGLIGGSTSDTLDCSIAFAQAETGDIATDYIATTTAAVSVGPVANVPRLDYLGSSCPRLLLEPQRTNVNTKSNDFTISSGYWYDYNSKTPVANQGTSPDGTNNAWSIPTSSLLTTEFGRTIGLTIGDKTAASIWAKGSETAFRLYIQNVSNSDILGSVTVNLTTGAITSGSGTVQSFGNGWYRISTIGTSTITNGYPRTIMSNPNTSCLIYGSQYEEGAYATSYIPTLGASVTRGADAASKTGISSLIGQTEGTLFVEGEAVTIDTSSNSPIYITVSNGNQNDICYIQQTLDGPIRVDYFAGGVRQARITSTTTYPLGTKIKAAFGYKSGDFVFYINGVLIGTETTGTSTAPLSKITIGAFETANFTGSAINQALLFKTRLPNSSLAELTSL